MTKRKHLKRRKTSLVTTDDGNEDNRQQTQIYAKDSLDRFGDDLCELLLSYLSLEDCFEYECVSKQFQRTVFESVVDIHIYKSLIKKLVNEKTINVQMLATIAIKCSNIQTIDCRGIGYTYETYTPEVLNTFRNNCRHLRDIYVNIRKNSSKLLPSFGSLVTELDVSYFEEKPSLIPFHRLSQLSVRSLNDVFDSTSGQLIAKNLQKISFQCYLMDNNKRLLSAFLARNQSLKSLSFRTSIKTLKEISGQLTQLRELTLNLYGNNGENSLSESLRTIGLNCKQLQRLTLQLMTNNTPLDGQILDSLRYYHSLKRLHLKLNANLNQQLLEPLKLCLRLTHLTLDITEISGQNSGRTNVITGECLSHISILPALQMLVIKVNENSDLSDNDFSDLLSRSPKLKNIHFIKKYKSKHFCTRNGLND